MDDIAQPRPIHPGDDHERAESALPPHMRESVTKVPVTPDITRDTYESDANDRTSVPEPPNGHYFSRRELDHAIAPSPDADNTAQEGQTFQEKIDTGAREGHEFLRRLSEVVVGNTSSTSESGALMHDIRVKHPDLALTGNIISATFNIPHSLRYRKGADWVS